MSPITPPPELVQQWRGEAVSNPKDTFSQSLATRAAQWGADQELEACCEYVYERLKVTTVARIAQELRTARRPKPPSLKEQALAIMSQDSWSFEEEDIVRRALEQLDD
jgi:hypothetical protein